MSTYTLTQASTSGPVNYPSVPFTVTPQAAFTGVITPASSIAGFFTPSSLTFTASTTPQTFTFTPTVAGTANISTTNTGGFTDPAAVTYLAVTVPISYITTAGYGAIATASSSGPAIQIASFKIGSDNIFNDASTTLQGLTSVQSGGANSAVYSMASSSQLQYSVLATGEVSYIVTLDETVGNFTIGNIGLYTNTGTLFAIMALPAVTSKIGSSGGVLGNRRVYEFLITFSNASTLLNLTILTQYATNLATVPTELVLPSPTNPPFNAYLVQTHSILGVSCLALNYNNAWTIIPPSTGGLAGAVRNGLMPVTNGSSTATFTADEIIVESSLGSFTTKLANFSQTINLATTGANGMDTGSPPNNSYVAIYAIYNPTTKTAALLGVSLGTNSSGTIAPPVYGGASMPSGYAFSGLVAVVPTNSSGNFKFGLWVERTWFGNQLSALNSPAVVSVTALNLYTIIPGNARSIDGLVLVSSSNGSNSAITLQAQTSGNANKQMGLIGTSAFTKSDSFTNQPIIPGSQTVYYSTVGSASPNFQLIVTGYSI